VSSFESATPVYLSSGKIDRNVEATLTVYGLEFESYYWDAFERAMACAYPNVKIDVSYSLSTDELRDRLDVMQIAKMEIDIFTMRSAFSDLYYSQYGAEFFEDLYDEVYDHLSVDNLTNILVDEKALVFPTAISASGDSWQGFAICGYSQNKELCKQILTEWFYEPESDLYKEFNRPEPAEPVNGLLVIGYNNFEPWSYTDRNGDLTGFDIELARTICAKLNLEPVFVELEFDLLIGALNSGAIDCIWTGMGITEERMQLMDFTIPYVEDYGVAFRGGSDLRSQVNGMIAELITDGTIGALAGEYDIPLSS